MIRKKNKTKQKTKKTKQNKTKQNKTKTKQKQKTKNKKQKQKNKKKRISTEPKLLHVVIVLPQNNFYFLKWGNHFGLAAFSKVSWVTPTRKTYLKVYKILLCKYWVSCHHGGITSRLEPPPWMYKGLWKVNKLSPGQSPSIEFESPHSTISFWKVWLRASLATPSFEKYIGYHTHTYFSHFNHLLSTWFTQKSYSLWF